MHHPPTAPDWAQPGRTVAVGSHGYPHNGRVALHRVQRVTATQIILDNDTRFRIKNLQQVGTTLDTQLYELHDPMVIRARRAATMDSLSRTIVDLIKNRAEGHESDTLDAIREAADLTRQRLIAITACTQLPKEHP